jgi:hypothetical protein
MMRLLLDPSADEFAGAGGASTPNAATNDSDRATFDDGDSGATTDTGASNAPAGGDPSVDATRTPPAATTSAQGWQSIRDAATAFGFQVPQQFRDDRSFSQHILAQASQAQQNEYNARLGQQLAPQLQNLLQRRQQPATPPVPTTYGMPCPAVPPFG